MCDVSCDGLHECGLYGWYVLVLQEETFLKPLTARRITQKVKVILKISHLYLTLQREKANPNFLLHYDFVLSLT